MGHTRSISNLAKRDNSKEFDDILCWPVNINASEIVNIVKEYADISMCKYILGVNKIASNLVIYWDIREIFLLDLLQVPLLKLNIWKKLIWLQVSIW